MGASGRESNLRVHKSEVGFFLFIAKLRREMKKKRRKKEFAISTYMRKRRAKPLTIETSVTELMLKTYVARTVMNRIGATSANLSKAVQVC